MTTTQHTQGKWTINAKNPLEIKIYADGDHLCNLLALDECNWAFKQNEANANLIAAAPDLLEALETIAAKTELWAKHGKMNKTDMGLLAIQARAAIAKAKGN